jgi:hypothetical protein
VILDRQGNLTGLKSLSSPYQEAVKTALTRQKVEPPPFLAKLTERSGTLLSGSGEGISFAIYSPVGTAVGTDRPTFRWQALSGAENYIVTIYDSNYSKVETSEPLSGTEWNLPRPLVRGGIYIWKVTALKDGKKVISPQPPAPEARFKVLEKTRADELEQARQAYSNSHLLLGTLYGQAGLLDDSEREFQLLLDANPGLPVAQKLLRNVRALRRQK